jgi:hypothetical protein
LAAGKHEIIGPPGRHGRGLGGNSDQVRKMVIRVI